jgi:hypothetical protein
MAKDSIDQDILDVLQHKKIASDILYKMVGKQAGDIMLLQDEAVNDAISFFK